MNTTETQAAVMACMERMHRIRFWHSPNGMSAGECKLLRQICSLEQENGFAAVSELSRLTGMKSASVSRTMNALEQRGMIERSIDPEHRRQVRAAPTTLGRETDELQQRQMCTFWNSVFKRIPEQDVTELLRIWNEILDSMEAVVRERGTKEGEA